MTMNYSNLYQKIKHQGYRPSSSEIERIKTYLKKDMSLRLPESHAAIHIFCKFNDPTKENIYILKRFLSIDSDDYARSSALYNFVFEWNFDDACVNSYIEEYLSYMNNLIYFDTIRTAFSSAIYIGFRRKSKLMRKVSCNSFARSKDLYDIDGELYGNLFLSIFNIVCLEKKINNEECDMASSEVEAYDRYHEMQAYFTDAP